MLSFIKIHFLRTCRCRILVGQLFLAQSIIVCVQLVDLYNPDTSNADDDAEPIVPEAIHLGRGHDDVNPLNHLFFVWTSGLLVKGARGQLTDTDELYELPAIINVERIHDRFQKAVMRRRSLGRALFDAFGCRYVRHEDGYRIL